MRKNNLAPHPPAAPDPGSEPNVATLASMLLPHPWVQTMPDKEDLPNRSSFMALALQ